MSLRPRDAYFPPHDEKESFPRYLERVMKETGLTGSKAQIAAFDEYSKHVNLEDYLGHWVCLAFADAWFQAFGYDAKAHYYETDSDKAMRMRAQLLTANPTHLRFHVKNEQKLFLFNLPVPAYATAETLNKNHTRLKVDFGFGADPRGNYLIIGYEPHKYAVVGDFDYRYLWFLVPERDGEVLYEHLDQMKEAAIKFGYTRQFIDNMNYREKGGKYRKG